MSSRFIDRIVRRGLRVGRRLRNGPQRVARIHPNTEAFVSLLNTQQPAGKYYRESALTRVAHRSPHIRAQAIPETQRASFPRQPQGLRCEGEIIRRFRPAGWRDDNELHLPRGSRQFGDDAGPASDHRWEYRRKWPSSAKFQEGPNAQTPDASTPGLCMPLEMAAALTRFQGTRNWKA